MDVGDENCRAIGRKTRCDLNGLQMQNFCLEGVVRRRVHCLKLKKFMSIPFTRTKRDQFAIMLNARATWTFKQPSLLPIRLFQIKLLQSPLFWLQN